MKLLQLSVVGWGRFSTPRLGDVPGTEMLVPLPGCIILAWDEVAPGCDAVPWCAWVQLGCQINGLLLVVAPLPLALH